MIMPKRGLTAKQSEYCRQRAAGKGYREAYKAAGYSTRGKDKTLVDNAYNMETHNTDIIQKIKDLQDRADAGGIMDRKARMQLLVDFALNDNVKDQDRLRALDQLARMNSDYTDRMEISGRADINMTYAERIDAIRQGLENDL